MAGLMAYLNVKNISIYFIQQWHNMADLTSKLSKANSTFLKIAAISTGVVAVFGLYTFYKNNIWSPKITIDSIDYSKGIAYLTINGKPFVLRGESSYLIAYDWGVRFGTSIQPNGQRYFDRIEILKRGLVDKILRNKDDVHSFTGRQDTIVTGALGVPESAGFDVFKDKSFTGNEETFWDDAFFGGKGSFGGNVTAK
jgi:hypothetical protein